MANQQKSVVPMKALLEAGVHFGHRTRRWNPKMKPFIFTERNGIHIIDLQQTITRLNEAHEIVKNTVASGGTVLFVGTKKQAQDSIVQEANRSNMPYVENRWLGGTLTNWRTIRQRIEYLLEIEKKQARGEFERLIKKEALLREREIDRLNRRLRGLKQMRRLPNLLFITDVRRDDLAVREANILGIPIIAMVDTNCDPDPIDYIIPSNDDAIRAIKLIVSIMADAAIEGRAIYNTLQAEEEEAETLEEEEAMERYLGPSTLAKIQAAAADEEEEEIEEIEEKEPVPETEEEPEAQAEAPEKEAEAKAEEPEEEEAEFEEVVEEEPEETEPTPTIEATLEPVNVTEETDEETPPEVEEAAFTVELDETEEEPVSATETLPVTTEEEEIE